MEVYVVRHAIAEDRRPGLAEQDRALTKKGREKFEAAVRGLERWGMKPALVLHSPLLRAVQTAEILAPLAKGGLRETPLLAKPPGSALLDLLAGHERVAVVGHRPWLNELVCLLAHGSTDLAGQVSLGKGGMAWLTGSPVAGGMALEGLYRPSDLVLMGA